MASSKSLPAETKFAGVSGTSIACLSVPKSPDRCDAWFQDEDIEEEEEEDKEEDDEKGSIETPKRKVRPSTAGSTRRNRTKGTPSSVRQFRAKHKKHLHIK